MNWIHRIAGISTSYANHFDALWYLLTERNCLTIGWQYLTSDPLVLAAVNARNPKRVKAAMAAHRVFEQAARGLANFSTFEPEDVVFVLPVRQRASEFLIVKLKTQAQSILNTPPYMQAPFDVNGGTITFNTTDGFVYPDGSPVDAGFFCEVEILARVPWEGMNPLLDERCRKFRGTNTKL